MEKFLSKNVENIKKLNNYIHDNYENIHQILVSPEMFEHIKLIDGCEIFSDYYVRYKGKQVKRMDAYFPTGKINFVLKNLYIEFSIPCVCGIYKDEPHDIFLK